MIYLFINFLQWEIFFSSDQSTIEIILYWINKNSHLIKDFFFLLKSWGKEKLPIKSTVSNLVDYEDLMKIERKTKRQKQKEKATDG